MAEAMDTRLRLMLDLCMGDLMFPLLIVGLSDRRRLLHRHHLRDLDYDESCCDDEVSAQSGLDNVRPNFGQVVEGRHVPGVSQQRNCKADSAGAAF
jgi:hypothetical protein